MSCLPAWVRQNEARIEVGIREPEIAHDGLGQGGDEPLRYQCALSLSPSSDAPVDALIQALGDASWRVRKAAVQAARRMHGVSGVREALVDGMANPENAGLRTACAEALVTVGEPAVAALSASLDSADADLRKFIVEVLGEIASPGVNAVLISCLDDADDNVRTSVIEALGRIGGPAIELELRRRLRQVKGEVQQAAYYMDALVRARASMAFDEIQPWLGRPGLDRFVMALLGACRDSRAISPLVEGFGAGRSVRRESVQALATLAAAFTPEEVEQLRAALNASSDARSCIIEVSREPEDDVARAAVVLMGVWGAADLVCDIIFACAERSFVEAGVAAVLSLGAPALSGIVAGYEGLGLEGRVLALELIAQMGDERFAPFFLEQSRQEELRVAEAAIDGLARVGDATCISPLIELAYCRPDTLGAQVALALGRIAEREPTAVNEALLSEIEKGRETAYWLEVLGTLAHPKTLPIILRAMRHRDPQIRRAAMAASVAFGLQVEQEYYVFGLADEHASVREVAARALGRCDNEAAMAALLVATRDAESRVVAAALGALGEIGRPEAIPALSAAVNSAASPVAIAALQSIQRVANAHLPEILLRAMKHPDPEVVSEAVAGTEVLDGEYALPLLRHAMEHASWYVRRAAAAALVRRGAKLPTRVVDEWLSTEAEPVVAGLLSALLEGVVG